VSLAAQLPWPKQSRAELSEAEKPGTGLHLIWDTAPVGIAHCVRHGVIAEMNPAFSSMLGCRPDELTLPYLAKLICDEDPREIEKLVAELLEGQRTQLVVERPRVSDGKKIWTRWTMWALSKQEGESDSALVLAEDLNPSRHGASSQAESQQMEAVGRLVGGVAHDFNNLLTGISLYCDLLLASLEPGHCLRHYVEEIRGAGHQAAGLIRQLLAVASPHGAEPRVLIVNEVIESVRNLLTRLIGENIELLFHLDPNLGAVNMDPAQVQQILLNLVLNARDALPQGGQIMVETLNSTVHNPAKENPEANANDKANDAPPSPHVVLMVSDNGHGMDAETQGRLFEPFFTTRAAGKNSGIGLSTVHNIVDRNGGRIHVSSAPAQGTRVTVELRQVCATSTSAAQAPEVQVSETRLPGSPHFSQLRPTKDEGTT
jgi:PAS domain S-box-containing protein